MKKILVVSDPEFEMDFETVCQYCATIQERLGNEVFVLPIWPHGKVDLIGDKRRMKLEIKKIRDILDELEIELEEKDHE